MELCAVEPGLAWDEVANQIGAFDRDLKAGDERRAANGNAQIVGSFHAGMVSFKSYVVGDRGIVVRHAGPHSLGHYRPVLGHGKLQFVDTAPGNARV